MSLAKIRRATEIIDPRVKKKKTVRTNPKRRAWRQTDVEVG